MNPRCKFCAGETIILMSAGNEFACACRSCGKVTITGTESAKFESSWSKR